MALVPIDDEGIGRIPTPFVTIHEKFIDGLVFRYAEHKNEAYMVIKDAATQVKLTNPKNSANDFKRRFKNKYPHYFKTFRAMTPGGSQDLNFATLEAINVFCSRVRNIDVAIPYIAKLTQLQKWFSSTRSALTFKEEQAFLEDKLKGDINFLSSEVKFLHVTNSSLRSDVTLLAQAVKQLQTQIDVNINRDQIKEIYDRIQQLAAMVSDIRGLAKPSSTIYKTLWINFNNHFKIARYRDLPSSKYVEALELLTSWREQFNQELAIL